MEGVLHYGDTIRLFAQNTTTIDGAVHAGHVIELAVLTKQSSKQEPHYTVVVSEDIVSQDEDAEPPTSRCCEFRIEMPARTTMNATLANVEMGARLHFGDPFLLIHSMKNSNEIRSWNNKNCEDRLTTRGRGSKGEMTMTFVKQGSYALPVHLDATGLMINVLDSRRKRNTSNKTLGVLKKPLGLHLSCSGKGSIARFGMERITLWNHTKMEEQPVERGLPPLYTTVIVPSKKTEMKKGETPGTEMDPTGIALEMETITLFVKSDSMRKVNDMKGKDQVQSCCRIS